LSSYPAVPDRLSRGVAVESQLVDAAARNAAQDTVVGSAGNVGAELSGALLALEGEKVSTETSNVGRSHRSARDGVLFAVLASLSFLNHERHRLTVRVVPPIQVLRMLVPGAQTSTAAP
jgi:hypothetical protein